MAAEARDWETLRSDAIRAVREVTGDDELAERATDAVLSVIDEETTRALCDEHIKNTNLRSMDFRNGAHLEIQPARAMVAYWVGAARTLLEGAENYSETRIDFGIPEDPQRYAFVVQKAGKLTPHEARRQAEDEIERLKDLFGIRACRHCGGEIIQCPHHVGVPSCKGWKHTQFIKSMPIGAHYCEGRSVNPSAEPAEAGEDENDG